MLKSPTQCPVVILFSRHNFMCWIGTLSHHPNLYKSNGRYVYIEVTYLHLTYNIYKYHHVNSLDTDMLSQDSLIELVLMLRHLVQRSICIISGRDVCLGNIVLDVKTCWARHLIFHFPFRASLLSPPLFAGFEGLGSRSGGWCEL